eukprot:403342692
MGSNGAKTESLDHSSSGRQQDRTMPADTTYNNQMTQGNRTQQIPQGSQMMSRQNETTYNDSVSKQDFMAGLGNDISNAQTLRRQQSVGSVQIKGLRGLGNTTNASNLIEENDDEGNNIFDRQRSNSEEMKMDLSHEEQKVSIVLKSNQNPNGFSKKLLSDESVMNQMNGEFSIITSYGNDDQSSLWSVNNPHKPTKQDHFVYTVNGIDNEGQFEVFRRFKEFYLLRQVFVERCPGLYIPPIPPKKAMKNTKQELIEERAHLLNLFIKQVVRCPYLFRSEELYLFIRPHIDIEKALTLLPKLNYQENLERISKCYSFIGQITETQMQRCSNKINAFAGAANRMSNFLDKFREMANRLEIGYDAQWINHKQLNDLMGQYEESNLKNYTGVKYENFLLFKHPQKTEAKDILESLPTEVVNPFKIMKLWIKWEQLDIDAINEAISAKSSLERGRYRELLRKSDNQRALDKLKKGEKTIKTIFMSKKGQINKITQLTQKITDAEKQMECFDLYLKIVTMQQLHAAIPFFKRDKVQIYNDLINTYSKQQINNCSTISACYAKLMNANKQEFNIEDEQKIFNIHDMD